MKKLVLLVIAERVKDSGEDELCTWVGQDALAAETEAGIRTVRRVLAEFESSGLIVREQRRRPDGYRTSDRIRLNLDWTPTSPARESGDRAAGSSDQHVNGHRPESQVTERPVKPGHHRPESPTSPATDDRLTGHSGRAIEEREVEPEVEPEENKQTSNSLATLTLVPDGVSPPATSRSPVEQVFDAWVLATGRTSRTRLDAKRRRRIEAALKSYPLEDILDAVQGWQNSPFHCGKNETGTVYNDLDLLLRDAEKIEKFRDLARAPAQPAAQRREPKSFDGIRRVVRKRGSA